MRLVPHLIQKAERGRQIPDADRGVVRGGHQLAGGGEERLPDRTRVAAQCQPTGRLGQPPGEKLGGVVLALAERRHDGTIG